MSSLKLPSIKPSLLKIRVRNLSKYNLETIESEFKNFDQKKFRSLTNVEEIWSFFKEQLMLIIDKVAPEKDVSIKQTSKFPWYDNELLLTKHYRDSSY